MASRGGLLTVMPAMVLGDAFPERRSDVRAETARGTGGVHVKTRGDLTVMPRSLRKSTYRRVPCDKRLERVYTLTLHGGALPQPLSV